MENQIKFFSNDLIDKLLLESKSPTNSLSIQIPFSYALELVDINWNDILFAIKNGYFNNASAIEYAISLLDNDEHDKKTLELVCLTPSEITQEELLQDFVIELANTEEKKEDTKDKFMYLLLNLMFENKNTFEDPLRAIEIVYDDFNFPKSMASFVRYMLIGDDLDSTATEEKIYINWIDYLCDQKVRFKAT